MSQLELVLWAGLALGLAFGACGQISGFCLQRGLKEYWSGRHGYKLHGFAVALAVALGGTHIVASMGLVDIGQSLYMMPSFSWLLLPFGGLMFGYGMCLTNGCGARAVVLLGQGNLRSFVVLLCIGISAYITLTGVGAPLRMLISAVTTLTPASVTVRADTLRALTVWLAVAGLLVFALRPRASGTRGLDLTGGATMGLLVVAGWLITGWLGADEFEPTPVASLTFVAPIGETIQYSMIATGMTLRFGVVVVLGTVAGSFIAAALRGKCRLEGFDSPRQMSRYIFGAVLMGVGGSLATGCSIGQGLTGMSTLAYSSMIAALSIVAGARLAWMRMAASSTAGPAVTGPRDLHHGA
ncbi:YeeE/YedE family protein [Allopusillimonas ginsengisoli]|uniref:YeeE/YedE family protein n=1 Tax=Allopusillimonas ginsengisoli TaxID=453575 RepID=UPI00101EDCD4|nr:YeeE/YedE family protein [Allopusillimonas ginsengisoli]TEA74229.1 YeeE/YedE family protein [Allopusillimonas ginsengisoli]